MSLRINTNIGALNAHTNAVITSRELDNSLARLSSGLRINSAKDDASGMAIADQLRSQASTLGQAINNGNDAIGILQTADKAMDEQIKILDMIKTKATQAAQDGQSLKTRNMLQADINRLMEELDNIANTTVFNGKQLLSGGFINQEFQIGSSSNQTIKATIGPTMSSKIGVTRFETGENITAAGIAQMVIKNYDGVDDFQFADVIISTSSGTGIGVLAEEINRVADKTGVRASFNVTTKGVFPIKAGNTTTDFAINGVTIGQIDYKAADENGQLVSAINAVKDTTGVEASKDANGMLVLTSREGRGIAISGNIGGGAGIMLGQYENYGRLSLVKNSGQDISISGTGFGFDLNAGSFVTQTSISLRDSKGTLDAQMADATGFNAYPGGSKFIITQTISDYMSTAGSGFTAGSGYSIGSGNDFSALLAQNTLVVSATSQYSQAYMVSAGSGYSAGSGRSNFAFLRATSVGLDIADKTSGVTTLKGAMAVMDIAETAILNLDQTRADIGSAQQQLEVTINNISVTQVNVKSAESTIRDVDFASESANFSKQNILSQSGSYALAQANQVQQNVLRLLQ
ncbi:flagellin [Campylobacter sp. MIT 99-7217]|uniref:flagellin n=1 Tax=Campylobacter sp. MIT 99-7217 TaxID=535091 RepID=UPI0011587CDD|nr:flagellin [Campylobacter sp. MIT 99-7217]TQR31859.1 flagellin [Campylobacter sp. MIT 99-7217]